LDEIAKNKVWDEFLRQQDRDPQRVNLTDLWRAAGRPWLSPRRLRKRKFVQEMLVEGESADDPAWTNAADAFVYVVLLDDAIHEAVAEEFFRELEQDPAGWLLDAGDDIRTLMAMFASDFCTTDGEWMAGAQAILGEIRRRTARLGVHAQEAEVAKARRALAEAKSILSDLRIDGEEVLPTLEVEIALERQENARHGQEIEAHGQEIEASAQRFEAFVQEIEAPPEVLSAFEPLFGLIRQKNAQLAQRNAQLGQRIEAMAARNAVLRQRTEAMAAAPAGGSSEASP
jgi:hypothetical protein